MPFENTWRYIQNKLHAGQSIDNWTKAGRYERGQFSIEKVEPTYIEVKVTKAKNNPHVPKGDFEKVYDVWSKYIAGSYRRCCIKDSTHFSKYIISVLHWVEKANGGTLP